MRPLTDRMSRCAVCLAAIAITGRTSSSSAGGSGYMLRINNRRCSREQTASMHPSNDQSRTSKRSSHRTQQHQEQSTWSVGRGGWACNQPATAGQFVIGTQPPAGSATPSANPLEMHRQTGKGRKGVRAVWQMAERVALPAGKQRDRWTDGRTDGEGAQYRFVMQWRHNDSQRPSCWPPVTAILNHKSSWRTRRPGAGKAGGRTRRDGALWLDNVRRRRTVDWTVCNETIIDVKLAHRHARRHNTLNTARIRRQNVSR